jgi:hypothetical protein
MSMRARSGALIVTALWLIASPLRAGAATPIVEEALRGRLRHVEAAFRQGDARALRECLSESAKVRVDLPDLTQGQGLYGAGQLQVIFSRVFEQRRTRSMAFPVEDVRVPAPGTAFARGVWVHVGARDADSHSEVLMFTLHAEGTDWRVIEMRSAQ